MTREALAGMAQHAAGLDAGGDWEAADLAYTVLFNEAARAGAVTELSAALRKQARVRYLRGLGEEALELALLSFEIAERCRLPAPAAGALNLLGFVHHSSGEMASAEAFYRDALERARHIGDSEMIAAICQNLGVLANVRGDVREARALYLESVGSIVRTGDRRTAMAAYNNLGMVCTDLGEWLEAEVYFGRGIEIAEQLGAATMLAMLHANYAEPLIRVGEIERARASLDLADSLARDIGDVRALCNVERYRGKLARVEGEHETAERHLKLALDAAEDAGLDLERGEALEELALLRHAEDRPGPARMTAFEAVRIYESLGADRDAARVREAIESWKVAATAPAPGH